MVRNPRGLPTGVYGDRPGFRAYAFYRGVRVDERGFRTAAEAEEWRRWALDLLRQGLDVPKRGRSGLPTTVPEVVRVWWRFYRAQHPTLADNTVEQYEHWIADISEWFRSRPVNAPGLRQEVANFMTYLANERNLAESTAQRYLGVLRNAFELARDDGLMTVNPATAVFALKPADNSRQLGDRPRISPEVLLRVSDDLREEHRVAFWMQLLTGVRVSEAWGFRLEDLEGGGLWVRRQRGGRYDSGANVKEATKTGQVRRVAVPTALEKLIRSHLAAKGKTDPHDYILDLPSNGKHEAYRAAVRRGFEREHVVSSTGRVVGTHNLRYEFQNIMLRDLELDGGLRSRLMGHRKGDGKEAPTTVKSYTDFRLDTRDIERGRLAMDSYVEKYFGGTLDRRTPLGPGPEWMPALEAARALGLSSDDTVRHHIRAGRLSQLLHLWPGENVARSYVLRADVQKYLDERDGRLSLRTAAKTLGLTVQQVRELRTLLALDCDTGGVSQADLTAMKESVQAGAAFRSRAYTREQAQLILGFRPRQLGELVTMGELSPLAAEGYQPGNGTTWFDRRRVEAIARTRRFGPGARPRVNAATYLTIAEAGTRLGVSRSTVHRLVRDGILERVGAGRLALVTVKSIRKFERQRELS